MIVGICDNVSGVSPLQTSHGSAEQRASQLHRAGRRYIERRYRDFFGARRGLSRIAAPLT
jgi:hypothetical protein